MHLFYTRNTGDFLLILLTMAVQSDRTGEEDIENVVSPYGDECSVKEAVWFVKPIHSRQSGETTQTSAKGKSGSAKGKGKARACSISGSRSKPPSKSGTPKKGNPPETPKFTPPKAPALAAPVSTSAADTMAPPMPALDTTQSMLPIPLAEAEVGSTKPAEESMEIDAVLIQCTLNAVASQTAPMEEEVIQYMNWVNLRFCAFRGPEM